MTKNPSRKVSPDDRWTVEAKENNEYWLCECGVARIEANSIIPHLEKENHIAERIDEEKGRVTGIISVGFKNNKYGNRTPDTAQINREQRKNDPLFPR